MMISIICQDRHGTNAALFVDAATAKWIPLQPGDDVSNFCPAALRDLQVGNQFRYVPGEPTIVFSEPKPKPKTLWQRLKSRLERELNIWLSMLDNKE